MSINEWLIFSMAAFTAAMVPGPISILAISTGMSGSRIGIFCGGVGNAMASVIQVVGAYMLVIYAATYLNILLNWVAVIGGCYLIFISYTLLRSNPFLQPYAGADLTTKNGREFLWTLSSSFLITLSNPKAILFFGALFPQLVMGSFETGVNSLTLLFLTSIIAATALISFFINASFGMVLSAIVTNRYVAVSINSLFAAILAVIGLLSIISIF